MRKYFIYFKLLCVTVIYITLSACNDSPTDKGHEKYGAGEATFDTSSIIQQAIRGLDPTFNKPGNDFLMSVMCSLVRGDFSLDQANKVLLEKGLDSSKAQPGDLLSLLNEKSGAERAVSCASYLASSINKFPIKNELTSQLHSDSGIEINELDPVRQELVQYLRVQLAISRANADIYAFISRELQKRPGLNLDQYISEAQNLFSSQASSYVKIVKQLYILETGFAYSIVEHSPSALRFTSTSGFIYVRDFRGVRLYFYDTPWLGNGFLLGTKYNVTIPYIQQPRRVSEEGGKKSNSTGGK